MFFQYYFKAFLKPQEALKLLLADKRYFRYGVGYMMIPIAAYTLMYVFLVIGNGAPSVFTPWLNIPKDVYYSVNRFLLGPSMLLCWFMTAAVIQVLSHFTGSKGSFEQTLAAIALSISIAMWGGLIHDLPMSFLSAVHIIDARQHEIDMNSPTIWRTLLWVAYSIYAIAFFVLFTLSVRIVHNTGKLTSFLIGLAGFAVFQLLFFVFNR